MHVILEFNMVYNSDFMNITCSLCGYSVSYVAYNQAVASCTVVIINLLIVSHNGKVYTRYV